MKYKIFLAWIVSCFSVLAYGVSFDLTDPDYVEVADIYPNFEMVGVWSFEDTGNNRSLFALKSDKNADWDTVFVAMIGLSLSGKQRVYISLSKACSEKDKLNNIVIKTNDTNVKYYQHCDGEEVYVSAVSDAGQNYLVREFKKDDPVTFILDDMTVRFFTTGFENAWNSFGGDAI